MEKLILKDQTEILVEGGTTTDAFTAVVVGTDGVKTLLDSLTEDNLSYVEMQNEVGLVCAVWENRQLGDIKVTKVEKTENLTIVVTLVEKDMVTQRLETLEAGQQLLDDAVAEMSETVYS